MDGMEKDLMENTVAEVPAIEVPTVDIPTTEEIIGEVLTETPIEEMPVTEAPIEEMPVTEAPIEEMPVIEAPGQEMPGQWNEVPMMQQQPGQWNNVYMTQPVYPGQWQEMNMASLQQPGQWNNMPQHQTQPQPQMPQMQQPQMGQTQMGQPQMGQPYVPWNTVPQQPYGQWNNMPQTPQNPSGQWNNMPQTPQNPGGQWNNVPPVYPANGYQNPEVPKKKGGYALLIIFLVLLGLLWLGGIIFAGYRFINKLTEANEDWMEDFGYDTEDDWFDSENDDKYSDEKEEEETTPKDDSYDWKTDSKGNYVPTANDPYYMEFVDSISDDLSYKVEKDIYEYSNENNNVDIYIETPVIKNFDNADTLNKHMADTTRYLLKNYANNPEKGNVYDCEIVVNSYITYMDENILSIVIDQRISMAGTADFILSSFNVDMKTGQLLWNRQLLNYTDDLAKEFRRMSDYQNGSIDYLENISNEELLYALTEEGTSVAFFTPVGMEIGFSYNDSYNVGWVTATIKEYEKYQ